MKEFVKLTPEQMKKIAAGADKPPIAVRYGVMPLYGIQPVYPLYGIKPTISE